MIEEYTSLGLMSGTSGDGVDASIIQSNGNSKYEVIKDKYYEYDSEIYQNIHNLKEKIHNFNDLKTLTKELNDLERKITLFHSKVVKEISDDKKIDVIGFHGQTIYHNSQEKISNQLGDGKLLSQLTKKNIVYNFRENDLKNGGQGAPLVPIYHKLLQKKLKLKVPVVFINIGGISNLTYLNKNDEIISFDSGPGNFLIDKLLQLKSNNKIQFDKDGEIASKGSVDKNILDSYLSDPYYDSIPPKSLDVNDFNLSAVRGLSVENSIATLSDLTAQTIVNSLNFFKTKPHKIILCGGGRKNLFLIDCIKKKNIEINLVDEFKIDGDFIESQAFAYLAIRSTLKKKISYPNTTGVKESCTGGVLVKNY